MINVRHLSGLGLSLATFVLVCACDNPPTVPSGPYTLSGVVTQMTASGKVPAQPGHLIRGGGNRHQRLLQRFRNVRWLDAPLRVEARLYAPAHVR